MRKHEQVQAGDQKQGEWEQRGLVEHDVMPSKKGPERIVYSLTGAGRKELLEWVKEPAAESKVRDEQLVKALCYPFLPEADALAWVGEVRTYFAEKVSYYQVLERSLKEQAQAGVISLEAYLETLLTLRRGIGAAESYVRWCDEAAELLSAATSPL